MISFVGLKMIMVETSSQVLCMPSWRIHKIHQNPSKSIKIHQNPSNPVSFHSRLSHMLYKSSMSKGSSAPNMWHPILKHTQLSYCMYLLAICFSKHIPIKWKSYTIMLVTYIFIAELHPLADDFLVVCNGIQPHTLPCRRTSPSLHG